MDGRFHAAAPLALSPAQVLRARTAGADRLGAVLADLVQALADLAQRHGATRADLRAIIGFLTEVGEATSDKRQEWVLLADVLGLTSTIEALATRRPDGATPNTLPGPFYRPGAPLCADGDSISRDGRGEPLALSLQVRGLDSAPVAGARVEVWQANDQGLYENQEPDQQPDFNLRGTFTTGPLGSVTIRTVRPLGYGLPADGPVGALMARLGFPCQRPAHIHLRITAPGYQGLTTHIFDRSDPAIAADPLFAVHPALLVDLRPAEKGWTTSFGAILAPASPNERSEP